MPKRMRALPAEYLSNQRAAAQAVGARLRARREQLDLTQEDLRARLELVEVYISRAQYSRIELGESLLDVIELRALNRILGVSYDWLIDGKGQEP